ncbi:MAG TPA: lipopolysaccharide heptosyltransferase II [Gammaproteobacteria bacterium]|jgi:heptosyltransferase-2|nr:lipopolysaccharide heptosyltransferase II [Gammaproteobacteria bacterium]
MAQKILIIGPSWVGDTVMSQSLFKLIKQQDPQAEIHVLAPAWTFSLLSRMPEIAQAIPLPITHNELKLGERYRIAKQLQEHHYTQAIILPNSFKSALIPWLAGIPKRTGWRGEYRYGVVNDLRVLDKKRYPLMVEQYIALGLPPNAPLPQPYPIPTFSVSKASQDAMLVKHNPIWRNRPVLVMCPGAEFGPSKRWPAEYYAQVANQKIQEGWDIWLSGSQKDRAVTQQIMTLTEQRCDDLAGRVDLAESIDLLSLASGIITNDSGLMHVAAALNKPLIAVYGSTSPGYTPPLSPQATVLKLDLPCQPCFKRECPLKHHRCMLDLKPEQVLAVMAQWGT